MSRSELTLDAQKALRRWTKRGLTTYIRPIDRRLMDRSSEFEIVWRVTVEFDRGGWKQILHESKSLSSAVIQMDADLRQIFGGKSGKVQKVRSSERPRRNRSVRNRSGR